MNTISEYSALQRSLACGWNTWNTRSVLSHVLLPVGFALNLGIKEHRTGFFLDEALIGRRDDGLERIVPGARSYDGSYTTLRITWRALCHLHENYCANTGQGCNYEYSDAFYHWGGLLGAVALIEAGHLPGPEQPLHNE